MPEKAKEEAANKRTAILAAASELFARKGYEETTIAEIAQAAGIAVGTVYLYFRNKHEILTGVALSFETSIAEALRDPRLLDLPIEQIPQAIVEALFQAGRRKKELAALLQINISSNQEILLHKEANAQLTNTIAAFFQHAIDRGELASFDTQIYAQLLNLLGGSLLHQCFAIEKGEREEWYRHAFTEFLERLLFGPSLRQGQAPHTGPEIREDNISN